MPHTIFIVEDDPRLRAELSVLLERCGYPCVTAVRFDDIPGQVLASEAHLVLLDLGLPVGDGHYICRELRRRSDIPIIVVTSRCTELDELMSVELGADDFLTKPYNTQIFLARVARLLHRAYPAVAAPDLSRGGLTLDAGRSAVRFGGGEAELTRNELRILQLLLRRAGRIVSRDELMNALWQSDAFVDDNTLTVNVNRLRKKLEGLGAGDLLVTRRGQGYQLCGEGRE